MIGATAPACPDVVVMAAFVDGRLEGSEREGVLTHLSTCADCREWLSETTATLEAMSAAPAPSRVPRPALRRLSWAAGVAATVLLAFVAVKRPAAPAGSSLDRLTADLVSEPRPVAATLWGDTVVRGPGARSDLQRQSFALGVLEVDLRVAIAAGDVQQARVRLDVAAQRLGQLGFMEEQQAFLKQAALSATGPGKLAEIEDQLQVHEEAIAQRLDADFHALGRWAEAGRLAALHRRDGYFADASNLPSAQSTAGLSPDARDALAAIERQWPTSRLSEEEGRVLASSFESLIQRLQP